MLNVEKHIRYWRASALEDLEVGSKLVADGRVRHGLFFTHLALEKILKAFVCRDTREIAPKTHDLVRLSGLSKLSLSQDRVIFLARFGRYQIEGRYPEMLDPEPSRDVAAADVEQAKELFSWLTTRL